MRRSRRANAAITALSLSVLLGMGALAVDVAYERVANAQLQTALDAAALAAVARLDGTAAAIDTAREVALEVASFNVVYDGFTLAPEQIEFGEWTVDAGFVPTLDPDHVNAVRIVGDHTGLRAILAGVAFGEASLDTRARAMAARPRGGPASDVDCWLPIALPYCEFADAAGTIPDPIYVKFGTDKVDNVGWSHPETSSTSGYRDQLLGNCSEGLGVGDPLQVSNGRNQAVIQDMVKLLNDQLEGNVSDWPYETFPDGPPDTRAMPYAFEKSASSVKDQHWGRVIAGPIALVDLDCDDPKFNNAQDPPRIMGFTYGFIYDVLKGDAHDTGFMLQLDFANEYSGGVHDDPGADGNTIRWMSPPVLVN